MKNRTKAIGLLITLGTYGACLAGVIGFFAALVLFINGDPGSASFSLLAAGASFGLLANALLRD